MIVLYESTQAIKWFVFYCQIYGSKATISNLSSCGMNKNYYKFLYSL